MPHDPLSASEALRTRTGAVLAAVSLLAFIYSVAILSQLLLGVMIAVGLTVGLYITYRSLAVLDSIADAAQRFAAVREQEADEASQVGSATDPETTADRTSSRLTEREE